MLVNIKVNLIILTETSFCHFTFHRDYRNRQASKSFEEGNKIYKTDLDLRYLKKEIGTRNLSKAMQYLPLLCRKGEKACISDDLFNKCRQFLKKRLKKGKTWFIQGDFWIIFNLTVSNIYFAILSPHAKSSLALFQPFCKLL